MIGTDSGAVDSHPNTVMVDQKLLDSLVIDHFDLEFDKVGILFCQQVNLLLFRLIKMVSSTPT